MRLTPDTLTTHLKKEYYPLYLLYGSEPFLIEESARAIRQAFLEKYQGEHEIFVIEGSSSQPWDALHDAIHHRSLFASTRLIDIRLTHAKITAKETKLLDAILSSSFEENFFIVQLNSLSYTQQQEKWFVQAEKKGASIAHWPLTEASFSRWIENRLKQKKLSLSEESLQLLIYHTEGNCLAAAQEIECLSLLDLPNNAPSFSFLETHNQFTVFDLTEAILKQNTARVVHILHGLKTTGIAVQLIFWALAQTLKLFAQCQAVNTDAKKQTLLQQARIKPALQSLYLKRLQTNSPPSERLLADLFTLDKMIKMGQQPDPWHEITSLCLELSGISNFAIKNNKNLC